jgi:hypothetical protein
VGGAQEDGDGDEYIYAGNARREGGVRAERNKREIKNHYNART